jgi:hypothetical protein
MCFFVSCLGFAYKKRIFKDYYLIGVDDKNDISISRKLQDGNFIGRIENVKRYAITNDSLLFALCINSSGKSIYYILNAVKDSEFADPKNVVMGPIDSADFIDNWTKTYNHIKFVSVLD